LGAELFGALVRQQGLDKLVQIAFENNGKIVNRHFHAMIGDPALRKVIGANLLGSLSGANL